MTVFFSCNAEEKAGMEVVPVFISVDPERDTVEQVREYVKGILLLTCFQLHFLCLQDRNWFDSSHPYDGQIMPLRFSSYFVKKCYSHKLLLLEFFYYCLASLFWFV